MLNGLHLKKDHRDAAVSNGRTNTARGDLCALGVVVFLAACVRVPNLGSASFWVDEAASWSFARLPLVELWTQVPTYEPHPPLYYTFLKASMWLIGESEVALRVLSTCAGVLTVVLVYCIGRTALGPKDGRWVGVVSAAIIALHPIQIYYSQETRAYALLTLAAAMVLLALVWWLRHPEALAMSLLQAWRSSNHRAVGAAALFVAGAALGLWMHHTAVLLLGSLVGCGVLLIIAVHADRRQILSNLALYATAIVGLWLPGAIYVFRGVQEVTAGFWIQPPSLHDIIYRTDVLIGSAGITPTHQLQALVLALVGVAGLAGAAALAVRRQEPVALLLCAGTGLPIIISVAASFAITPIFIPRVLVWIQLSGALLVASAVLWLPSRLTRTAGAAALVGIVAAVSVGYPATREPWREIVHLLAATAAREDLIIAWPNSVQLPFHYYRQHERVPAPHLRLWDGANEYPTPYEVFSPHKSPPSQEVFERVSRHTEEVDGSVWLVTRAGLRTAVVAGIEQALESQRGLPIPVISFQIPGGLDPPVRVVRYPRRVRQ
jgi:mannosyltransferase